jgi:hypothetical protein
MDHAAFDDLIRALGTGTSRRTLVKRLAGGALGGLFGLRTLEADATHKKGHKCNPSDKHSCPEGYTCVDKKCVKKSPPPTCSGKDQGCDEKHPCCDGYYCDQTTLTCKPT